MKKQNRFEFTISTHKKTEFVEVTNKVQEIVSKSEIKEGICVVYCPHTTAGITINENADPDVKSDILNRLGAIVPENENYSHSEGNSDAHIKSALIGNNQTLIVSNGKLQLGSWGGIFFSEFDGPRQRQVLVQLIKQ
jgi:secondary thiamine-phosphate synthase enzyme